MIKVLTVLGTRPEIIKMSLILNEFDKVFKHIVVIQDKIMIMN